MPVASWYWRRFAQNFSTWRFLSRKYGGRLPTHYRTYFRRVFVCLSVRPSFTLKKFWKIRFLWLSVETKGHWGHGELCCMRNKYASRVTWRIWRPGTLCHAENVGKLLLILRWKAPLDRDALSRPLHVCARTLARVCVYVRQCVRPQRLFWTTASKVQKTLLDGQYR